MSGPCHALGGARHRCDGPATWRRVRYTSGPSAGRESLYRWCSAAVAESRVLAEQCGEGQVISDAQGVRS